MLLALSPQALNLTSLCNRRYKIISLDKTYGTCMSHIHFPSLGTVETPNEIGVPVVAGITIAPVVPALAQRFASIGPDFVIDSARAEGLLLGVLEAPQRLADTHHQRLCELVGKASIYLVEAEALFPVIDGTTESSRISGMVAALGAATPALDGSIFADPDTLRRCLPEASGVDTAKIGAALDQLDQVRDAIAGKMQDLAAVRAELEGLQAKAASPEAAQDARKRKSRGKAERLLPAVRVELLRIRDEASRLVAALDGALSQLETVP